MSTLIVKRLSKHFAGVQALNNVSFTARGGEVLGIIGPNGSGKSTLLDLLSGVVVADQGELVIGGKPIHSRHQLHAGSVLKLGITRTFQTPRLFDNSSVLDNMLMAFAPRGVLKSFVTRDAQSLPRARAALSKIGLWSKRDQRAGTLSYGQKKLLEIARVVALDRSILLLDEPFAGLFPAMRQIISGMVHELRRKNKTVLLVEHDMRQIARLCDRVLVLDNGAIIAEGTPAQVLRTKKVREAYLGT
ncbi:MAG: ABC transporter ATP-binding protein [bacterium]|nr:ABC transporter ATP-binding protein [bacterium]